MQAGRKVRIIKKVKERSGVWKFVSLLRIGTRYMWNKRPGYYFLEWWQGKRRCRQLAGSTPTDAQRRKRNELIGELIAEEKSSPSRKRIPDQPRRAANPLLRTLKEIAAAKVANATLHKFRHTYAARLLESGCDIVTVQKLMGHSDIETTRQYLNPDEALKRSAVNRLSLPRNKYSHASSDGRIRLTRQEFQRDRGTQHLHGYQIHVEKSTVSLHWMGSCCGIELETRKTLPVQEERCAI